MHKRENLLDLFADIVVPLRPDLVNACCLLPAQFPGERLMATICGAFARWKLRRIIGNLDNMAFGTNLLQENVELTPGYG